MNHSFCVISEQLSVNKYEKRCSDSWNLSTLHYRLPWTWLWLDLTMPLDSFWLLRLYQFVSPLGLLVGLKKWNYVSLKIKICRSVKQQLLAKSCKNFILNQFVAIKRLNWNKLFINDNNWRSVSGLKNYSN